MNRHFAIVVLAIVISLGGNADAKVKIYKSNSNLPFVEMMLGMMVAMGILDKIPPELIGIGGYPASPLGYQNLGNQNQLKQYLASRYLGNRYPGSNYPGSIYPGSRYLGSRYPGSGYPRSGGLYPLSSGVYPGQYGSNAVPFYQNPMLGFPGASPLRNSPYNNRYRVGNDEWRPMRPSSCIGGACLAQPSNSLNGLWIAEDGEMLGIKHDQFFWTDGRDAYMSGLMDISDDHVIANIDGSNDQISYEYRVQGNDLLTRDSGGVIHNFRRYPVGRPLY